MIKHVRHSGIDKKWWDERILASKDRSWYAMSHVLDAAAPGWEALVDENTGAVMPLTGKRTYGFHYLYQPFAIQKLGVFATVSNSAECGAFLSAIPDRFKLWDIRLNTSVITGQSDKVRTRELVNMVVELDRDMEGVRERYGDSHRRGLRKWSDEGKLVSMNADQFMEFIMASDRIRDWGMGKEEERVLRQLVHVASEREEGSAMGIRINGAWASAGFFVKYHDRTIFLKGLATGEGRKVFAMHRLIDTMIERSVGSNKVFDLAGGEHLALRRFYAGFGARPELYLRARVNRLPQPLRWYKERIDGA